MVKYQQRDGWSHGDLLRLAQARAHPQKHRDKEDNQKSRPIY